MLIIQYKSGFKDYFDVFTVNKIIISNSNTGTGNNNCIRFVVSNANDIILSFDNEYNTLVVMNYINMCISKGKTIFTIDATKQTLNNKPLQNIVKSYSKKKFK